MTIVFNCDSHRFTNDKVKATATFFVYTVYCGGALEAFLIKLDNYFFFFGSLN